MLLLIKFAAQLAWGLACSLLSVPVSWVQLEFFRVHSYVVLGLGALVAGLAPLVSLSWGLTLGALVAGASYVASLMFAFGLARTGKTLLAICALAALAAAMNSWNLPTEENLVWVQALGESALAGLVPGAALVAMLLGHWYLNWPGMKLQPLKLLIGWCAGVLGLRVMWTLGWWLAAGEGFNAWDIFWLLRVAAGLIAPWPLLWMSWQTLKIPNTQSATGILYVVVILTLLGELCATLIGV